MSEAQNEQYIHDAEAQSGGDYYTRLGVKKNANPVDIKKAFRKLVREYHPDVNHDPNAPAKFREIVEAYQTLSDEKG